MVVPWLCRLGSVGGRSEQSWHGPVPLSGCTGCQYHHHYGPSANNQDAIEILNTTDGWSPAIESCGGIRDGAWVAEATGLVEMSSWPPGTRLVLR